MATGLQLCILGWPNNFVRNQILNDAWFGLTTQWPNNNLIQLLISLGEEIFSNLEWAFGWTHAGAIGAG